MKLGLRKPIRSIDANMQSFKFSLIKFFYGFEKANIYYKKCSKNSVLKILKRNKAKIGVNCDIEVGISFHNCKDYSNLTIGNNCHIGKNCFFDLKEKISIGNNVTISMGTSMLTHQDVGKSSLSKLYKKTNEMISVKDNAYIGANVSILKGVIIGKESLIAAGI